MQVQALQNDGKGYFKLVTSDVIQESTVGRSWGMAVDDVNRDGKPDLFIGQWEHKQDCFWENKKLLHLYSLAKASGIPFNTDSFPGLKFNCLCKFDEDSYPL